MEKRKTIKIVLTTLAAALLIELVILLVLIGTGLLHVGSGHIGSNGSDNTSIAASDDSTSDAEVFNDEADWVEGWY